MSKIVKLTIRLENEVNQIANLKCKERFGIPLATLLKLFIKAFINVGGIGFYIGDEDLYRVFDKWLFNKRLDRLRKGCAPLPGPRVKELFNKL